MPSLQSLVVTDRQTTPVNRTLIPVGEIGGVGVVEAMDASGVPLSAIRLSISNRKVGGRVKATEKWRFPTMATEVVNGVSAPKVLRTGYVDAVFTFEDTHTEAERRDIVGMFYSAHAPGKVLTEDTIIKGQSVY